MSKIETFYNLIFFTVGCNVTVTIKNIYIHNVLVVYFVIIFIRVVEVINYSVNM